AFDIDQARWLIRRIDDVVKGLDTEPPGDRLLHVADGHERHAMCRQVVLEGVFIVTSTSRVGQCRHRSDRSANIPVMRIIAGRHQHRKLVTPRGLDTRPMLDRVKQALFDALGSRYSQPGRLAPLNVLDVYCGGGTLGIESLSRGAAWCTFVENSPAALQ